jgi:S1-C subfamily serine protease
METRAGQRGRPQPSSTTYAAPSVGKRARGYRKMVLAMPLLLFMGACAHAEHAATLSYAVASNPSDSRQAVIDRIVTASVKITREQDGRSLNTGSGVVIASRQAESGKEAVTYILTAAHVLAGKDSSAPLYVRFGGQQAKLGRFTAAVVRQGNPETLDVGLLRVPGIAVAPVRIAAEDSVKLGESILVVGFPWGQRLGMFGGIVSQIPVGDNGVPDEGTDQTLVVDAATCKGVSGGGVFRQNTGSLIGLVEGYQTTSIAVKAQTQTYSVKVPMPGETYVVPLAQIRKFLAETDLGDDQAFVDVTAR